MSCCSFLSKCPADWASGTMIICLYKDQKWRYGGGRGTVSITAEFRLFYAVGTSSDLPLFYYCRCVVSQNWGYSIDYSRLSIALQSPRHAQPDRPTEPVHGTHGGFRTGGSENCLILENGKLNKFVTLFLSEQMDL